MGCRETISISSIGDKAITITCSHVRRILYIKKFVPREGLLLKALTTDCSTYLYYPGNTYIFQEVTHTKIVKSANQHRERFRNLDCVHRVLFYV